MCKLGWAPTWRISKRNSTDNASWAGVPTWKLTKKSAYYNVQVGVGPNTEADEKVSLQYQ
ncbi:TPA: hypothetical protein NJQ03_000593 [Staphylococcus aureus]|nr:hypothetical protein [Staphylococcus aureus]HCG2632252.1 hypothetical protein [Staphylococcus aureus]HCG2905060.1 hypothetical protein [Staphylococcus aureus]HCU9926808.1 hypothetical protein [Staphylococcus aureus]HCY8708053.1 hypothetical protein [Staphylococcus aureus]